MSYMQYINFYTKTKSNYGRFTKRGRKDNYWLDSVKINDKLDILDGDVNGDTWWGIATVLDVIKTAKSIRFYIHYDGWEAKWDGWVNIDYSTTTSFKLKPLHSFTPKHLYLIDKSYDECHWKRKSSWRKCDICNIKCCTKCFIIKDDETDQYLCKHCMELLEPKQIFNAIYEAIAYQFPVDVNIIHLLTDYAMGYVLNCCNRSQEHQCPNPIFLPSRFPLAITANDVHPSHDSHGKIYYYKPVISSADTECIFGTNLRIFCEFCTKRCLKLCSICDNTKDILPACYKHGYRIKVVYGGKGSKCYPALCEREYSDKKEVVEIVKDVVNEQKIESFVEESYDEMNEVIYDSKGNVTDKYYKRGLSKKKEMRKRMRGRKYHRKRCDKYFNVKENRKFMKRYAMFLQYW